MITLAALAVLAVAGVVSAVAARWTFTRYSDQAKVRAAQRQIKASLYELRLFVDEPAVLLRAQRRLVTSNLRYIALMLRPLLMVSGPIFFLMTVLDSLYGYGPITQGASAVVTVKVQPSVDLGSTLPAIEATQGIALETPVVRIPGEYRFYWRIRATGAGSERLKVLLNGAVYEKSVRAGGEFTVVSRRRVRSIFAWMLNPTESRLPPGVIERIEVAYPTAWLTVFGLTLHWTLWFTLAAAAAAIWLR